MDLFIDADILTCDSVFQVETEEVKSAETQNDADQLKHYNKASYYNSSADSILQIFSEVSADVSDACVKKFSSSFINEAAIACALKIEEISGTYRISGEWSALIKLKNFLDTCLIGLSQEVDKSDVGVMCEILKPKNQISTDAIPTLTDHQYYTTTTLDVDDHNASSLPALHSDSYYKFFCSSCSFKTKRESHFKNHQLLHKKVNTVYCCEKCSFRCIRAATLSRHVASHEGSSLHCPHCSYTSTKPKLMQNHITSKHDQNKNSKPSYSCSVCEYKTSRTGLFQRHVASHKGILKCLECSYETSSQDRLKRHISSVHKNERPYLCDTCGNAFKRKDALEQHRTSHIKSRYQCDTCKKACRSSTELKDHMRIHSDAREFLCEQCGVAFKTRTVHRKHVLRMHLKPGIYACDDCNKRFNNRYGLKRHKKQHEGGKKRTTKRSEEECATDLLKDNNEVIIEESDVLQDDSLGTSHYISTADGQAAILYFSSSLSLQ